MTTRIVARLIDYQSGHERRVEWVWCPWCEHGDHTIEFVQIGGRWIGFCPVSNRMVEGIFSDAS